jgi:hypothetical protein
VLKKIILIPTAKGEMDPELAKYFSVLPIDTTKINVWAATPFNKEGEYIRTIIHDFCNKYKIAF